MEWEIKVADLESGLRKQALALWKEDYELPPQLAVKQFTVVEIPDPSQAREWCFNNFRPALKLDTKVFEKAAKDGSIPAELALVSKEARAQIATVLEV
jgi:hypothetical protein